LLLIAGIGKTALNIHLHGLTNHPGDNSVDAIQTQLIPLLKNHYKVDNELSMKIISRGYLPNGGGHVHIVIPSIRRFNRINLEEKGYIKRVRGTCAGSKISTSILNEVKDKCKSKLLEYLPDVWIYSDYYKGEKASLSPGYSLTLQA
jgi:RNA 3'-terminal phosphate cyclase-like protein